MPRPSIFLVHGRWISPDIIVRRSRWTSTLDQSGVVAREWEFLTGTEPNAPSDLRYWEYEKGDFSIRLDTEAGPFEQILLQAALRSGDATWPSAMQLSGMQLSGMQLSGMQLAAR